MRVLIIGAQGYVGSVLSHEIRYALRPQLLAGMDLGWFAGDLILNDNPDRHLDYLIMKDIREIQPSDIRGFEVIVNLAALSNDPIGHKYSRQTKKINSEACVRLGELCVQEGVGTLIFASSCSIYGAGGIESKTEQSETVPLTDYAVSKIETETELRRFSGKLNIVCLRFATACGFSPRFRTDLVVNDFVVAALKEKIIHIMSDGTPFRPLISVRDMSRAIIWFIDSCSAKQSSFQLLNVGYQNENFTVLELAELVRKNVGDVQISINKKAAPDKRSYRVDFTKFSNLTRFVSPLMSVEQCIQETANSLRSLSAHELNYWFKRLKRLGALETLQSKRLLDDELKWLN